MSKRKAGISMNLVLLGDSDVGKTRILASYITRIRPDFVSRRVCIEGRLVELRVFDIQVWPRRDIIAGDGLPNYPRAPGILLVYNIAHRPSFDNCAKWLDHIYNRRSGECCGHDTVVLLVGHCKDVDAPRVVTTEEGKAWANDRGLLFIEVSALNGHNIQLAMRRLACEHMG
ncbi:Ras- protein Rab6 [Actinomortierella ambigua]|uniref:Ras- protein Rab6 n=1 Tax=Actinomortierella ambigua TaxID=1343610 RepID=A0A9P6UAR2_9FUNG|nr:Ras- protein Rab6 [Actinomortierella ambigua]